jgi:N4-gp56 family major capsid protein|nr:MAG TPA: major capsid protein [Bacteriophage sp.]
MSTVTKLNDVINPQVMGDMIEAKITAQAKLTPYAKVDTSLEGVPGDTKTVPSWNYIGDAQDFDPENRTGAEIDTTNLTASSTTFTIKCAGKSVGILQTAINSGLGNPIGQAESQLAKSIVGKVDNDVLEAAYTAPITVNKSDSPIGYNAVVDAVTKFEDEEDGIDKVMFIHPKQETTLLKDPNFLSADKFQAGVAVNGAIGKIAGCWIKKSKKVKEVAAVNAVAGVYTIKIDTKAATGDKIIVNGVAFTAGTDFSLSTDTATGNATALTTALNASENEALSCYTWSSSGTTITATEDSSKEGSGLPTVTTEGSMSVTVATTTKGVAAASAAFLCPVIKMEADSSETEYTEDELPALTIFLKKNTQVDHEWFPKKQRHDITATKYYGVALTNAAKVILAKFGK